MTLIENVLSQFGYVKASKLEISRLFATELESLACMSKQQNENMSWKVPEKHLSPPSHYNYTFHRLGSLIATGYLGKGVWQVRCQCGNYTARDFSFLKQPRSEFEDCCEACFNRKAMERGVTTAEYEEMLFRESCTL